MRIAFMLGSPDISGGTYVIIEYAVGLAQRGHQVTIISRSSSLQERLFWHPRKQDLRRLQFIETGDIHYPVSVLPVEPFDILFATWHPSVFDLFSFPALCYAYLVQSVESRFFAPWSILLRARAELTYCFPLPVITIARWMKRYLSLHFRRQVMVNHFGIDKEIFSPNGPSIDATRPHGMRVLVEGLVGSYWKLTDRALRLCFQAGIKDIWLLTPTKISAYPGVSRVFSSVPLEQTPAIYRSCDVLVKMSRVEGMFGPPLEMLHCGGTVISYNLACAKEYLVHNHNAIIVPMYDDRAIVFALQRLAGDRVLLAALKKNALATAERIEDCSQSVQRLEKMITDLVAQAESCAPHRKNMQLRPGMRNLSQCVAWFTYRYNHAVKLIQNYSAILSFGSFLFQVSLLRFFMTCGSQNNTRPTIQEEVALWLTARFPWAPRIFRLRKEVAGNVLFYPEEHR